ASDGEVLQTWTNATSARAVVVARGRVFVAGQTSPGNLYLINPNQAPGDVTVLANNLGNGPAGIAFAGFYLWTANLDGGSISRVDPNSGDVTTFGVGFNQPRGIIYDGANLWVTDTDRDALLKVNSGGEITQTINVGDNPGYPIFDGVN